MDAPIKVVKDFITEEECLSMVEYIDFLEGSINEKFDKWQDGRRIALQFGADSSHGRRSYLTFDLIADKKDLIQEYFLRIINETKSSFNESDNLYLCSLWLAKQYEGAKVPYHDDTDSENNMHFKYSAILYFNETSRGGELKFKDYNYSYKPAPGDLVIFPTQGTGHHGVEEIFETRYSMPLWLTDQKIMKLPY
jgi:hypothetical protein